MRYVRFLLVGIFFGIVLSKSEAISWYRIYEMFQFKSFHMYGIMGSAAVVGIILVQTVKRMGVKTLDGKEMELTPKKRSLYRYLIGGIIFGLGWALAGACPGPMFILIGKGVGVIILAIASAVLGTLIYGMLRDKLPH